MATTSHLLLPDWGSHQVSRPVQFRRRINVQYRALFVFLFVAYVGGNSGLSFEAFPLRARAVLTAAGVSAAGLDRNWIVDRGISIVTLC